jgi:hypothetical protein
VFINRKKFKQNVRIDFQRNIYYNNHKFRFIDYNSSGSTGTRVNEAIE